MKKNIVLTLFVSVFILLGIVYSASALSPVAPVSSLDQLPTSCIHAHDGCNNCFRASGDVWACTMMYCENVQQPAVRCTGYDESKVKENPVMCTMEYAPVCGQPKMPECKTGMACATVMPQPKTYGNTCMMKADGATKISDGECGSILSKPSFCNASYIKLTRGSKGDYVRELQTYLRDQGYNPGSIDGIFGRQVASAVKLFQKNNGLGNDGIFGKNSRAKACSMF